MDVWRSSSGPPASILEEMSFPQHQANHNMLARASMEVHFLPREQTMDYSMLTTRTDTLNQAMQGQRVPDIPLR
eukprot:6325675-Amphidinium_carterae.1